MHSCKQVIFSKVCDTAPEISLALEKMGLKSGLIRKNKMSQYRYME